MFGIPVPGKLAIAGVIGLTVVTIIGIGYHHYTGLLETVQVLNGDNTRLRMAHDLQKNTIAVQRKTIAEWRASQAKLIARTAEIQQVADRATEETRRLNGLFSKHDLTNLALRKPGLIERRINAGTRGALRLLRCASGAEGADCPGTGGPTVGTPPASQP